MTVRARAKGTRSARILVIEDDEVTRVIVATSLRDAGLVVFEAASRAEGIRRANASRPNLIVIDRKLPDGDGWASVRALRRIDGLARVAVLAMTAHEPTIELGELEHWRAAGCDAFLAKPCDPTVLVDEVRKLLAQRTNGKTRRRRAQGQRSFDT